MHRLALLVLAAGLLGTAFAETKIYPNRWVYVSRGLSRDSDVEEIREIARTSAEHGLTALVLAAGLDRLDLQPAAYLERLQQVKQICADHGLELIPSIFSVGYGSGLLAHNRNLAEGFPVRDALFTTRAGEARLAPDPPVAVVNGGMEEYAGHHVTGYSFHDQPGEVSFVDTEVFREGAASLRFENFEANPYGNARIMQEIPVKPYRQYRVTCWVKAEDLAPKGAFRVQVLAGGRALAPFDAQVPATADWRKITFGFNSAEFDSVRVYAGVWAGKGGRFWVDEIRIEEVGLVNVLRRPGAPLVVKHAESGMVYEEGVDFVPVSDPTLTFRFDHEGPPIRILPGSRILDGERLRVDYYHGLWVNDGQVSACMSEPQVYEIWSEQARLMHELLGAGKYLLSMDEIRSGGTCAACKARGISMAAVLGHCITRQVEILREQNPGAEVYIWSDMLDPNHNARGNYYLVDGDFSGSWEHVPKDLGVVCWYYSKRRESLEHFSGLGLRTVAGAYYDGDTLDNPMGWLAALDETPGASGIMYTTWENKYELLGPFGDLLSQER
jgi:hypothetical protein